MTQIYPKPLVLVTRPEEAQRNPQTRSILHPRRSGQGLVTTVPVAERPANEPPGRKRGRGTAHAGPAAVGRRIIGQAESPMGSPAQSGLGWCVAPSLRAGVCGWVAQGPWG